MNLEEIEGLNSSQIKNLREAGFNTVEALVTATISELINIHGIGDLTAKRIWHQALEKLTPNQYISATELEKQEKTRQKLTTGSTALDELLGGGLETQNITEIAGEYGSGKSQTCHQLSINVQLPLEKGGLDGSVLYIDTENTFRASRIKQMAEAKNLNPHEILQNIIVSKAYTSDHQIFLLNHADKIIKENNIRLIIIDSVLAHFRSEYIGRELLASRQQQLNKHLKKLQKLATTFNCIALITNQAIANPTFFGIQTPTGGNIMAHASTTRIWLRRPKPLEPLRIARLLESPWLASGERTFNITEKGIEDTQ